MKTVLLMLALLAPGVALAYPNPNAGRVSAGEMVNTLWPQPLVAPTVLADATKQDPAD